MRRLESSTPTVSSTPVVAVAAAALLSFAPTADAELAWFGRTVDSFLGKAHDVAAADLDGDGDVDLLAARNDGGGDINWYENTAGDGTSWIERTIDGSFGGTRTVVATDVDGDLDLDVLAAGEASDAISWWENVDGDALTWLEHPIAVAFDGAYGAQPADIDGDGDTDVFGAGTWADEFAWWENTSGDGTAWTKHTIASDFQAAREVYPGDIDGDGDADLFGAGSIDSRVWWFENTAGDGSSWSSHILGDPTFISANHIHGDDVDGDGDLDVLASASDKEFGWIKWWENAAGDGTTWIGHTVVQRDINGLRTADIDGDGDTDIVSADWHNDTVSWWDNVNGDGTAWIEEVVATGFDGVQTVVAADVDGGGTADIIAGSTLDQALLLWQNLGPAPALAVSGACPGDLVLDIVGASGLASIALLGSPDEGSSNVPTGRPCEGTPLGIDSPTLLTTVSTGPGGNHTIERTVATGSCGLLIQAVDLTACETTGVGQVPDAP